MAGEPATREELEAARCWEADDDVPGRPAMTAFRRATRLHHARWREAHGHPIGTQPIRPRGDGSPVRPVGSRIPLDYGRKTGATFLTAGAWAAARERTSRIERHQSFDHQRLWADLLSSEALAFNLFGDLAADLDVADRAVHAWWPDVPGTVRAIRFAYSPGRLDPEYLNSLRAFDAAIVTDLGGGRRGVVAIDTSYHERMKREVPKPRNRPRNVAVAERSGAFGAAAIEAYLAPSERCVMWLEHLLLFSMLQHPSGTWAWGRYVVVRPAGNPDAAELCERYQASLRDPSTFADVTLEELLDRAVLPAATVAALRERYLPAGR